MFAIGEFARLTQVSVRMLRHYDELGLLVPARVDPATGYRSYSALQIPRLNRLLALRDLGFSLEQIRPILDDGVAVDELRGMLRLRRAQIEAHLAEEHERLARVDARLTLIEQEDDMAKFDIVIKKIPPQRCAVASAPAPGFGPANLRPLIEPLGRVVYTALKEHGIKTVGSTFAFYDGSPEDGSLVMHVAMPIGDAVLPASEGVEVIVVPGFERAASVVHKGELNRTAEYYQALAAFIENNGCTTDGHGRDVFIDGSRDDPSKRVVEMQLPMRPVT